MPIATVLLGLLLSAVAQAAPMYRVDLLVTETGKSPEQQLMLVEDGKDSSMEIGGPDGGRRFELRVDAKEDEKGRITGTVSLRVVDLTPRGERKLGKANVKIAQLGEPVAWQPRKPVKGLDIMVTLYRQPLM